VSLRGFSFILLIFEKNVHVSTQQCVGAPKVREELHGNGSWMKEWMQVLKALASYRK